MTDVQELLKRRAARIEASPDALPRVLSMARRRRIRRRALSAGSALTIALFAFGTLGIPSMTPPSSTAAQDLSRGPAPARELRASLGIRGGTKGAPTSVIVRRQTSHGVQMTAVQVTTGRTTRLPDGSSQAAVAPDGDAVAAVSDGHVVVVEPGASGPTQRVVGAAGNDGALSWNTAGTELFALVAGSWVLVPNPGPRTGSTSRTLQVPRVPGGPTFLSVSPDGDLVILFGISTAKDPRTSVRVGVLREPPESGLDGARPHLFIGEFDGSAVTRLTKVPIPDGALEGPLGWVGDNAFLIAPGPGEALLVRTDGTRIAVGPAPIVDGCSDAPARVRCSSDAPQLLGTNDDGSLLFWRVSGSWTSGSARQVVRVAYFRTWLDGTHGDRLTGAAGRYGPPVAAR